MPTSTCASAQAAYSGVAYAAARQGAKLASYSTAGRGVGASSAPSLPEPWQTCGKTHSRAKAASVLSNYRFAGTAAARCDGDVLDFKRDRDPLYSAGTHLYRCQSDDTSGQPNDHGWSRKPSGNLCRIRSLQVHGFRHQRYFFRAIDRDGGRPERPACR